MLGAPLESRWLRTEPRRPEPAELARMMTMAFPKNRIAEMAQLGGLRNANFKVRMDSVAGAFVLRVYEHDGSLCRKELDLFAVMGREVPLPEVIYAEPEGKDGEPPFLITRYIDGITFRELKRTGPRDEIHEAAHAVGRALAAMGRISFDKSGWIGPGAQVTAPFMPGENPLPRFADACLTSNLLQQRLDAQVSERIRRTFWNAAPSLAALDRNTQLVHCDFGKQNVLMRKEADRWTVAAVIDWEFAVAGSPLIDVGHFLRYEKAAEPLLEPEFSRGFADAGGELPEGWRKLARIVDMSALLECLTRELPDETTQEMVELVGATAEDRDRRA
jgi:aminoglycoside phosphotransferase (APT) family kinase protein